MLKTYPQMKPSGIGWIGKIPSDWKIEPLKFHAKINEKKLDEKTDPDLNISYIDIGSVHSNGKIDEPEKLIFEDAPSRARRIIHENDTIISTVRTYLKAISFIDKSKDNHICSTGFAVITPSNSFIPKFFYYNLVSPNFIETIMANSVGVTYPAINALKLGRFPCVLPRNKQEQKQISEFLDVEISKIDNDVSRNEKLIKLLKEKKQTMINHVVTKGLDPNTPIKNSEMDWIGNIPKHWKIIDLKYLCSKLVVGFVGSISSYYTDKNGIPLLSTTNITNGKLDLSNLKYVTKEFHLRNKKSQLKEDDLIIARHGESGSSALISGLSESNCLNIVVIRPNSKIIFSKYVQHILNSRIVKIFLSYEKYGGVQEVVNTEDIGNVPIIFPPDKIEQERIMTFLDKETLKIDSLISKTEYQIEKLQEYRQLLISNAVTGKICVKNQI